MSKRIAHDALNNFVQDLRATHGSNLSSVILYGAAASSAAAGGTIPPPSANNSGGAAQQANLLIALERITPEDLRLAQAPAREWQRLGYPLPVYFTADELRTAADVFPIEFHQMERARVVLYGADPFASLEISDVNLRHQTEYELRSKLIQLRRLYVPASASPEKLTSLLTDSLSSFATLFAPVLLLHGQQPPIDKRDCVRAAVRLLRLDAAPFERIFELQRERGKARAMDETETHGLFAAYMEQIERVIEAVDNLPMDE